MKARTPFHLQYFLPLLDSLQTVDAWSGVPEKLARPLTEAASSTAPGTREYPEIEPLPSSGPTPEKASFTGKYDDASWHYGGDFPKDLPIEAGATHTGMFLALARSGNLRTTQARARSAIRRVENKGGEAAERRSELKAVTIIASEGIKMIDAMLSIDRS